MGKIHTIKKRKNERIRNTLREKKNNGRTKKIRIQREQKNKIEERKKDCKTFT